VRVARTIGPQRLRVPARLLRGGGPRSKGIIENLVGHAQSDPMVPQVRWWSCARGKRAAHSEIGVAPTECPVAEWELLASRPSIWLAGHRKIRRLSCVGSTR
jgi:hypothetical protein